MDTNWQFYFYSTLQFPHKLVDIKGHKHLTKKKEKKTSLTFFTLKIFTFKLSRTL